MTGRCQDQTQGSEQVTWLSLMFSSVFGFPEAPDSGRAVSSASCWCFSFFMFIDLPVPGVSCHPWDVSCSMWDLVPWPGMELWHLHWESRVLATRPPGKSHVDVLLPTCLPEWTQNYAFFFVPPTPTPTPPPLPFSQTNMAEVTREKARAVCNCLFLGRRWRSLPSKGRKMVSDRLEERVGFKVI